MRFTGFEYRLERPRSVFFRLPILATGVLVALFLTIFVGGGDNVGDAGLLYADELSVSGTACWASGNPRGTEMHASGDRSDAGWGSDYEYSLDLGFMWSILANEHWEGRRGAVNLEAEIKDEQAYYSGFRQAVDVAFSSYLQDFNYFGQASAGDAQQYRFSNGHLYYQTRELLLGSGVDYKTFGPWGSTILDSDAKLANINSDGVVRSVAAYLERRAVARYQPGRVLNYVARWYSPWDPDGGFSVDLTGLSEDQQNLMNAMVESSQSFVTQGNRILSGTNEVPAVILSGNVLVDCPAALGCSLEQNFGSTTTAVESRSQIVDQSNDERGGSAVEQVLPSRNPDRGDTASGYSSLNQGDSDTDNILVMLQLNPDFRADNLFQMYKDDKYAPTALRGFGEDPWTAVNFAGGLDRDMIGRDLNGLDRTEFVKMETGADIFHWGFRQPTLGVAWGGDGDVPKARVAELLDRGDLGVRYSYHNTSLASSTALVPGIVHDYVSTEVDGKMYTDGKFHPGFWKEDAPGGGGWRLARQWRQIRWPVNFEDLSWYLYELPGSAVEQPQVPWLALWLTEQGYNTLLASGYLGDHTVPVAPTAGDGCFFAGEVVGSTSTVPVSGQSTERQFYLPSNAWCDEDDVYGGSKFNAGEIKGDNDWNDNVGFGPFQLVDIDASFPPSGNFRYGMDQVSLDEGVTGVDYRPVGETADWKGVGNWAYFSQNMTRVGGDLPSAGMEHPILVRAGVERAKDADSGGFRQLIDFEFVISEAVDFGGMTVTGEDALDRYGVPRNPALASSYLHSWPAGPISPNQMYLLVIAFYEVYQSNTEIPKDDRQSYKFEDADDGVFLPGGGVHLPERRIRRVICRMAVYPAGYSPTVSDSGGLWNMFKDAASSVGSVFSAPVRFVGGVINGARDLVKDVAGFASRAWALLGDAFLALSRAPTDASGTLMAAGCGGVGAADDVLTDGSVSDENDVLVRADGTFVSNPAAQDRTELNDVCLETSSRSHSEDVCSVEDDVYNDGCGKFPVLDLQLHGGTYEWHRPLPLDDLPFKIYGAETSTRSFVTPLTEARYLAGDDPAPNNVGLTRVHVAFGSAASMNDDENMDKLTGYAVHVDPDPKVYDENLVYYLPRFVEVEGRKWNDPNFSSQDYEFVGFSFGDFGLDKSNPNVAPSTEQWYAGYTVSGAGGVSVDSEVNRFEKFLDLLPVAPGFSYRFRVAPWGEDPDGSFSIGMWSNWVTVDGDDAVCEIDPNGLDRWPPGYGPRSHILKLYGCDGWFLPPRPASVTALSDDSGGSGVLMASLSSSALPIMGQVDNSSLQIGLVDLAGTKLCGDIFTATPAMFTWDNNVVKAGWRLVWIIAGSLLFVLFVWQGLSMTYDTWISRQPSAGFRELVPRFLLAILLAVSSFWICKTVLILASDLGCFVAQATGMTMFGSLLYLMGAPFEAWFDAMVSLSPTAIIAGFVGIFLLFVKKALLIIPVLFIVIVALWVWCRVLWAMLMRIILIAVLMVLSPVAFAFYASPNTEHWMRTWLHLFLGTVFQQVVVLVVMYIGGSMVYDYVYEGFVTSDSGDIVGALGRLIGGTFFALGTLFLAAKVPEIINPKGMKMMEGFGKMLQMAGAAAVAIGAGGAGFAKGMMNPGSAMTSVGPGGGGGADGVTSVAPKGTGGEAAPSTESGGESPGSGGGGGLRGMASQLWGMRDPGFGSGSMGERLSAGFKGMQQGFESGKGINNRMRDFAEGRFLYRNNSFSDDAAAARKEQNEKSDQIIDILKGIRDKK